MPAARLRGRPPTAVTGVAACQGGKAEPGTVASVTAHAPLEGLCYTAMAAACGHEGGLLSIAADPAGQHCRGGDDLRLLERGGPPRGAVHLPEDGVCRRAWAGPPRHQGYTQDDQPPFVWHRCAADVSRWCRDCQECQHDKVTKLLATATLAIPVPEKRFSHLHVDLVGLLPTSPDGFKYMFTIIDCSTRWLEPVPVKNMEATTAADALVAG